MSVSGAKVNPDTQLLRRLAALEASVADLQKSGMLANAAVKAFLGSAGTNRGIKILDSTGAERARLGVSEAGLYGLGVNDGTQQRVQAGQITGGGYGMEVHDASGNLIWDTTGLASAMVKVGANLVSGPNTVTNHTSGTPVPNCSATFTISNRPQNILTLAKFDTTLTNQTASFYLEYTNGTSTFDGGQVFCGFLSNQFPICLFYDQSKLQGGADNRLAVGSWTVRLMAYSAASPASISVENFDIDVYQFGG